MKSKYTWKEVLGFLVMVVVADIITIGIYYSVYAKEKETPEDFSGDAIYPPPPSNSTMGIFSKAAIVAEGEPCATIGKDILLRGGSVIDATIAVMLCEGVCVMQSMGVGSGSIMTFYNRTEKKTYCLIARETAPAKATRDMFVNHSSWSTLGPLSAGVPGELKGYQEAYKRFGRLPWRDLFMPTIELCEKGVPVNKALAKNFLDEADNINQSPSFISVILNSTGGKFPKEGDFIKLPELARTLRVIAESPNMADELYNGSLTKQFVADIQAGGGIITEEDMNNYNVRWEEPYTASLSGNLTVYSAALPGSGILFIFMLRLLDGLIQFATSDIERSQLVVEAFKHAYGRRTYLSDPHFGNKTVLDQVIEDLTNEEFILSIRDKIKTNWTTNNLTYYGADYYLNDDHGTHNVALVGPDGSAVSITGTINTWFGSKFVSLSTGILLNNQMDDFSTPGLINYFDVVPSVSNFIEPGKRPLSSMCPTIIVNSEGDVRLAVGAAGGTKITTQTTHVAVKNLWLGKNIKEAIDEPRFHHQLMPMNISYEYGITRDMVEAWHKIGHSTKRVPSTSFLAVVTGVARLGDNLTANCDWRKPGFVTGF